MKRRQNDLFKLPNSIFTAPLNATQLKVLAVFYSLRSRTIRNGKKLVKISQKSLKKMCGIKSTRTISDAANTLCRLGYIERIDRYYDDYKRLGTFVYTIPVVSGRDFFFVSRRFFKYLLTSAQTRIPNVFYKHYPKYKNAEINKAEFARLCSLSYPTIFKYIGIVEGRA